MLPHRRIDRLGWLLGATLALLGPPAQGQAPDTPREPTPPTTLAMSPAVACLRVDGLEQFTRLPEATLTSADKLKVYFRPLHYKVETDPQNKAPYRAKFVEDGRIRRKGEKAPIAKEDKLLEYETRYANADMQIYLVNTIGLESLKPGEYELDIILHDAIDGQATARQTLPFRVVPVAPPPGGQAEPKPEPEPTKPAPTRKARSGRSSRRPG